MGLKDLGLALFFTRGISLRTWDQVGMLEREVAIYRRLLSHLGRIAFLTYGDRSDLKYASQLSDIQILCNHWKLPERWYIRLVSWLYWPQWSKFIMFKSNQIFGGDVAMRVARRFEKKFIARCGYLHSDFVERQCGPNSLEAQRARALEREVFTMADKIVVTTPAIAQLVAQRYQIPTEMTTVIPNYVDTDLFRPDLSGNPSPKRICFVGRLEEQKNPFGLLEAVKGLNIELIIIGNGTLRERLQEEASTNQLSVRFMGNVPHRRLPKVMNSAALFILPSHYEGHPKTLLEAMSCGAPVIGTNVPGIRELICHRETGYLCGTSPEEIRVAIQDVLDDADLRVRMGRNAREFAVKHFALERIVEMELALLGKLIG